MRFERFSARCITPSLRPSCMHAWVFVVYQIFSLALFLSSTIFVILPHCKNENDGERFKLNRKETVVFERVTVIGLLLLVRASIFQYNIFCLFGMHIFVENFFFFHFCFRCCSIIVLVGNAASINFLLLRHSVLLLLLLLVLAFTARSKRCCCYYCLL